MKVELYKRTEWLLFTEATPEERKTKIVRVSDSSNSTLLGEIKWYSHWRHYCYFPTMVYGTIYSDRCLMEIAEVVTELNEEHKKVKKNVQKEL